MGLATRIIPTLLARGDVLVKGKRFDAWRSVGHVLQAARVHAARGVDELIVLDIAATPEGRGPNLALVEKLTEDAFTPITVGGGVRTIEDVRDLLKAGADKVAIGTAASENHALLNECATRFGSQAIVFAVDYYDLDDRGVMLRCKTRCGTRRWMMTPIEAAAWGAEQGAGEILLTSIDREGTMNGYDFDRIRQVSATVDVPVIAHGGCGTYEHMREAIEAGASAVAAGALFQFTDCTPRGAAQYLGKLGIEVRV